MYWSFTNDHNNLYKVIKFILTADLCIHLKIAEQN